MKRYFFLYKQLLLANLYSLIAYRTDFAGRLFSSFMFSMWHVITVLLLTHNVPSVFGWSRNELLLLVATYNVFIGIFHAFVSRNISQLADDVYHGRLDFVLLRPIDAQVSVSIWIIDYMSLFRCIVGLGLTAYIIHLMGITITTLAVAGYVLTIIVGLSILYSIWISFVSLTFFFPRLSNIVVLLYNLSNIARYPQEMYSRLPLFASITLLPFALIMTTPVKVLVQRFTVPLGIEMLGICISLGLASRFIWTRSLRSYSSASS